MFKFTKIHVSNWESVNPADIIVKILNVLLSGGSIPSYTFNMFIRIIYKICIIYSNYIFIKLNNISNGNHTIKIIFYKTFLINKNKQIKNK